MQLSPRYEIEPDADELITLKNEVFGVELYEPHLMQTFSPRYDVDPDAVDEMVIKNDVFGLEL